ncbi:MAG: phage tail protein [Holophagaceae bacterium]|nr:phage tail protein [Holophagaceae bacterium]
MAEDMRVRLSADGIKEVIDSLKRVQNEVKKTGDEGKSAGDALGALGTLFAAQQIASFAAKALDAAEGLNKMSQKTGVAVEQLSVLTTMAATADVSAEDLQKGFNKLAKSMDALQSGDASTAEYFKRIGLSAKDLQGLSLDQAMVKIANAQAKYADGAGKAATMMGIFGKSGTNLIPLLNELANGGFEQARTKLEKLGRVLSGDAAAAAEDFNDSLKDLRQAAEGALVKTAVTTLPTLTTAVKDMTVAMAEVPAWGKTAVLSFGLLGSASTATVAALRTVGPAIIAALGSPLGLAVVGLSALVSGYLALKSAQESSRQEWVKEAQTSYDRVSQSGDLIKQYEREAKALKDGNLSQQERQKHEGKLKEIKDKLIAISPDYQASLSKEGEGIATVTALLWEQHQAHTQIHADKKAQALADLESAKAYQAQVEAEYQALQSDKSPLSGQTKAVQYMTIKSRLDDAWANTQARWKAAQGYSGQSSETKIAEKKPTIPDGGGDAKAALGKAQAAELAAEAKREAELEKASLDQVAAMQEAAYKSGLISLEQYLADKKMLLELQAENEQDMIAAQIKAEEKARAAAKKPEEKQAAQTKINDLENQAATKRVELATKLVALEEEAREKRAAAATESLKLESEFEAAQGQIGAKTLSAINSEYEARIKTASANDKLTLQELQRLAIIKKEVEIQQQKMDRADTTKSVALSAIEQNVSSGNIGYLEAQQQKVQVYLTWLQTAQTAYDALVQKAAQTSGGEQTDLLNKAAALKIQIDGVRISVGQMQNEWYALEKAGVDATVNGLGTALANIAPGTASASDAFRSMAQSILQALAQVIAKMMVLQALEALGGSSAGGSGGGGWMGMAMTAASAYFGGAATGGEIRGPGTGTSDSILARLSNGEFVQNAAAVSYYGTDLMHALNGLKVPKSILPKFAEGGMVGAPRTIDVNNKMDGTFQIGLERGLILEVLKSPEGARVSLNHAAANSKAMRRALGGKG